MTVSDELPAGRAGTPVAQEAAALAFIAEPVYGMVRFAPDTR